MTRNPPARLSRLTHRATALAARTSTAPGVIVVHPADAAHPPGTTVTTGGCVDVYHDPAVGEPALPALGPHTLVITLALERTTADLKG